jgi:hypothetical protein
MVYGEPRIVRFTYPEGTPGAMIGGIAVELEGRVRDVTVLVEKLPGGGLSFSFPHLLLPSGWTTGDPVVNNLVRRHAQSYIVERLDLDIVSAFPEAA